MIESNTSGTNGDSSVESSSKSANTSTNTETKETESRLWKSPVQNNQEKCYFAKLPWGVLKQTQNLSSSLHHLIKSVPNVNIDSDFFKIENKKPGEYLMNLIVFKFMQLSSKKINFIMEGEKRNKHLRDFFQKNEDPDFDKLIATMGQVAEKSLPSLIRTLLMWHEAQISNLNYLKQQNQQQTDSNVLNSTSKAALKTKQQAKIENDILDERKELMVNCILCSALKEILKQLPFHPGIDDLLNYIIDLSFQRFVPKDTFANSSSSFYQHHQLYLDNRFTVDLFAECIGVIAYSRFSLVKNRFLIEFDNLKSNKTSNQSSTLASNQSGQNLSQTSSISAPQNPSVPGIQSQTQAFSVNTSSSNINQALLSSQSIIKLLMGMKFIRIKMVPIEDFEASFHFLNDLAQYFVEAKDKDIKHTLAGLFVEILVPIIGIVKNEVNIPCLKSFVDILYHHAIELSAKSKHRLACLPLLTCLLCVSQKQFFLNYWFNFAQLCLQQMKSKETTLSRIALESVIRLVWVYMIRIKGEKSSDTNVRLNAIVQSLLPKGSKLVVPKEMPANLYVKMINYIAFEKLDYAMKEIVYELLSIDTNQNGPDLADQATWSSANTLSSTAQSSLSAGISLGSQIFKTSKENMIILPLRMEIGLKAFVSIADTLQLQKENPNASNPPAIASNFTTPDTDQLTMYPNQTLNESQCRDIGIGIYFEHVRRAFQDILKTLDGTIGRGYLMTRPENTGSASTEDGSQINHAINDDEQKQLVDEHLTSIVNSQKESIFSSDMRSRLSLFRSCIALMPRLMPCFKENELVDILTRLTIHLDDELKFTAFKTLKTLVTNYPNWRKSIFTGFTNFILKEISDMFPKLIENALKMLIQLMNSWKSAKVHDNQNLDDSCQIIFHLEGFSLFTLCHSSVQRRRYGHFILQECKQIGQMTNCFKIYNCHNYAIDIMDQASIQAIKNLHLQCLNINLTIHNTSVNLAHLIEQSAAWDSCINLSNYSDTNSQTNSLPTQSKSQRAPSLSTDEPLSEIEASSTSEPSSLQNSSRLAAQVEKSATSYIGSDTNYPHSPTNINTSCTTTMTTTTTTTIATSSNTANTNNNNTTTTKTNNTQINYVFTFDPWTECLATFFAYEFVFSKCPQARADAWLFIFARLQQILPFVDPNEQPEPARTSLLFGNNALERSRKIGERDINLNLWKNYLMGACCLTTGSDQDLYSNEYRKYNNRLDESAKNSSSHSLHVSSSTAVNYDFTIVESTSKFYANFATHTSLIKIIVPYLKCDTTYFREIVIRCLGRINVEAQRDLIEELSPVIKETADFKRQDKIRRLKKKDLARLAIVRIFELMAEQKTLAKRITHTFSTNGQKATNVATNSIHHQQQQHNEEQMRKIFIEFMDTIYSYVESEGDKSYDHLNQIRIHYSMFVYKFIDSLSIDIRSTIVNETMRLNLFNLMLKWCGRFGLPSSNVKDQTKFTSKNLFIHQNHFAHLNCYHFYEELELAAAKACAAVLYSGNVLDYVTNKNSIVFVWLNNLFEVVQSEIKWYENCRSQVFNEAYTLAQNCLGQLLDISLYRITSSTSAPSIGASINLSLNVSTVFDWTIDKCYATMSLEIADLCFLSLSKCYLNYLSRTKPNNLSKNNLLKSSFESIYLGAILSITLMNVGSTRLNVHESSVALLRALNKHFLQEVSFDLAKLDHTDPMLHACLSIDSDIINSLTMAYKSQAFISEYLAKKNPDQTMFIFCELTSRFDACTCVSTRRTILNLLLPWFYNIELINPNVVCVENCSNNKNNNKNGNLNNVLLGLESGYGSIEATHLVLNNLLYLTCKYSNSFGQELELLWATLASTWRSNLKIICRYIYVMISLAPYEMIAHGKRVICYLSRVCPERIVDELVNELEMMDSFATHVVKENQFPFYRYSKAITVPASPPPSPKLVHNGKKSSIYFVNQGQEFDNNNDVDDYDDENDLQGIDFINQSDFYLQDEDLDDYSDLSDTDTDSSAQSDFYESLKKKTNQSQLKLDQLTTQLPLPVKYQSFACPLNRILSHTGHHQHYHQQNHQQQNLIGTNRDYMPLYSYHNNYLHHNHYFHFTNLQRGSVSLMLLSEIVSNDGADFDWSQYLPILLHYCLLNFDNARQLIGEHAKKLLTSLLFIITVQNELNFLTDYLIETFEHVVDTRSLIYDRKYKPTDSDDQCFYNFNFNLNDRRSHHPGSILKDCTTRSFINIHSAPSSPAQSPSNNNNKKSNANSGSNNSSSQKTDKNKPKTTFKKYHKINKAKEHLSVLIEILSKCKNGPVWPFEYINRHNYQTELKSVQILNNFVTNLKSFLNICLSIKQVSTISSTRSVSSPLTLATRFQSGERRSKQLDKTWSLFALNVSFNTSNRHYAGRSLQIYRALNIQICSVSTMKMMIGRLKDTVADSKEDVQGYVTEILLTLKMNAALLSDKHLNESNSVNSSQETGSQKHKSKSLKIKKLETNSGKKFSTAIGSELSSGIKQMDVIKQKSATLSRKQVNQMMMMNRPIELQRFSTKYKHQISYRKCLTLSLFNYKWQVLQDRVGSSILPNSKKTTTSKYFPILNCEEQQREKKNQHQTEKCVSIGLSNEVNMKILSQIVWVCMCLLESDYEHEFGLACDILECILEKIDLAETKHGTNQFRRTIELFAYRIQWSNFPGMQNLLLKGCTNGNLCEKSQRLISLLIPYCSSLVFVDPYGASFYGMWGLSMSLLCILPTMIVYYENPSDLCVTSARRYLSAIGDITAKLEKQSGSSGVKIGSANTTGGYQKTKIEQLKNLNLVIELYTRKSFGKDKNQWAKCVITYMSEFFHLCECEQVSQSATAKSSKFYFNWIVLLVELLEKSNWSAYQSATLGCLSSLLNFVNFNEQSSWMFINEELLRVASKLSYSSVLHQEALDLIKLTVGKSSSLLDTDKKDAAQTKSAVPSSSKQQQRLVAGKRELPGRTLDFDFDFWWLVPSGGHTKSPRQPPTEPAANVPPLNLINFHANDQLGFLNSYLNGLNANVWDNPVQSQSRTRERMLYIYTALSKNQNNTNNGNSSAATNLPKSTSGLFESSLNGSDLAPKSQFAHDENLNLITNATLNNSSLSVSNSTSSPMSKRANESASLSDQSKSTSTSANQTSSNNSFNQTSFVFSPEPKEKKKPVAPIIQDNGFARSHNRANSLAVNQPSSIVNVVSATSNLEKTKPIGYSLASNTPGVSQQVLNTIDDNIFINNTFSFLDELESNFGDTANGQKSTDALGNKSGYESCENFPWHAILPVKGDQNDTQNLHTVSANSSSDALSKSFSSTSDLKINMSVASRSANKPMAPKIKSPATIGIATGLSTLKDMGLEASRPNESGSAGERTRSVTRIVSNENLLATPLKKDKSSNKSNLVASMINENKLNQASTSEFQEPIIKITSMNQNSNPGSPANLATSKPEVSKPSSGSNLLSPESIQRRIALNLLINKSRSLSRSKNENLDDEPQNKSKSHTSTLSKEELLKLEVNIKNIYNSSLPWLHILNLNEDDIEQAWKLHIQNILNSAKLRASSNKLNLSLESFGLGKAFNPIESFVLFKKLFVQAKHKLNNLLSECFQYLTIETKLFVKLEKHLVIILGLLKNRLDCPVVYFDLEWFMQLQEMLQTATPNKKSSKSPLNVSNLITTSFIDNHKRVLWEIGENYDTLVYLKHDVKDSLESIKKLEKSSYKSLHGSSEINSKIEKFFKKIELSRKFCKLVSQFMILLQSYSKLFPNLTRNLSNTTLTDLSFEMSNLKKSLKAASCELEQNGRLSPMFPVDLEKTLFTKSMPFKTILPNSQEIIVYFILEAIKQENYTQAIEYFKIAQKNWPNDFNKSSHTDNELEFDSILILVCEQARQKNSNMIAIIEPETDFAEISQTILQEIIEITNLINLIDKKFKENISSVLNDNENDDCEE